MHGKIADITWQKSPPFLSVFHFLVAHLVTNLFGRFAGVRSLMVRYPQHFSLPDGDTSGFKAK